MDSDTNQPHKCKGPKNPNELFYPDHIE